MLASQSAGQATRSGSWWTIRGMSAMQIGAGARFTPGEPLQDNAFRLLEQLPGVSHQAWEPRKGEFLLPGRRTSPLSLMRGAFGALSTDLSSRREL